MESFLPTEIARLVYGYLIEENCESAARLFLETSVHLKECLIVANNGRRFNTKVAGHTLMEILDKLCEAICIVKGHLEKKSLNTNLDKGLLSELKALLIPNEKKVEYKRILQGNTDLTTENIYGDNYLDESNQDNCQTVVLKEPDCLSQAVNEIRNFTDLSEEFFSSSTNCNNHINNNAVQSEASSSPVKSPQGENSNLLTEVSNRDLETSTNNEKNRDISYRSTEKGFFLNSNMNMSNELPENQTITRFQSVQFGMKDQFYVQEAISENNAYVKQINDLAKNISGSASGLLDYTQRDRNISLILPTSPLTISQLCNSNHQSALTSISVQLHNSPKIHVSVVKQQEPRQEVDHFEQPMISTYSVMPPLIRRPLTSCIKSPTNSSLIQNIFTTEHRPTDTTKENLFVKSAMQCVGKTDETPVIKRSGVRTRGGCVKRGGKYQRRVKAYVPKKINLLDDHTQSASSDEQRSKLSGESLKEIEKSIFPVGKENELTVSNLSVDFPSTTNAGSKLSVHCNNENENSEKPHLSPRNLRKRISLSVPRRGSHVRALDFKTPTKSSICNRRAITSPKQIHNSRSPATKKTLRVRGALFKSSSQKKELKAWDADIRMYSVESTDIPTSVGLRRKRITQQSSDENSNRNKNTLNSNSKKSPASGSETSGKKISAGKNEETNDDLAAEIRKEVLSVIGEEAVSIIGENTNLVPDSHREGELGNDEIISPTPQKNTESSHLESKEHTSREEHLHHQEFKKSLDILDMDGIFRLQYQGLSHTSPSSSFPATPVIKAIIQEQREFFENNQLSPLKNLCVAIPTKDSSTPVIEQTPVKLASPSITLFCHQDSLEASLIKECTRIEIENVDRNPESLKNRVLETTFNEPSELLNESIITQPIESDKMLLNKSSNESLMPSFYGDNQYVNVCSKERSAKEYCDNFGNTAPTDTPPKPRVESHCETNLIHDIASKSEKISNNVTNRNSSEKVVNTVRDKQNVSQYETNSDNEFSSKTLLSPGKNSQVNAETIITEVNCSEEDESPSVHQGSSAEHMAGRDPDLWTPMSPDNEQFLKDINEGENYNIQSPKKVGPNSRDNCNYVIEKMDQKVVTNKKNTKNNNPSISKSINSSDSFKENDTSDSQKVIKTCHSKVKNKKNSKTDEIDCNKLIAQCLQNAKAMLYGSEKKVTISPLKTITSSSRKEDQCKLTQIKRRLKLSPNKKKSNYSSSQEMLSPPPKIMTKSESVLFDSSSTSSENSELLELSHEKTATDESENLDDSFSYLKANMNENKCVDACFNFNDRYITRRKKRLLDAANIILQKDKLEYKKNKMKKKISLDGEESLFNFGTLPQLTPPVNTSPLNKINICKKLHPSERKQSRTGGPESQLHNCKNVETVAERKKTPKDTTTDFLKKVPMVVDRVEGNQSLSPSKSSVKSNREFECDSEKIKTNLAKNEERDGDKFKLSNYVYSFTLTLDGESVTKQLKVSQFYNIFEMESNYEKPEGLNRSKTEKECYISHSPPDSEEKNKKRKHKSEKLGNESKSDDRKYSPVKKHKRDSDPPSYKDHYTRINKHSSNRPYTKNYRHDVRSHLNGGKNYGRGGCGRYREAYISSRFKRSSTPRHWATRRNSTSRIRELSPRNVDSLKWKSYRNKEFKHPESSHRYSKEWNDSKNLGEGLKDVATSSRSQYKNECSVSSTHSQRSDKDKKNRSTKLEREDGELSESSRSTYSRAPGTSNILTRALTSKSETPPVDDDTRAKLKKVNLDQFLSLLHGSEK